MPADDANHRRTIAKSRQKACNACTKAKRRCDLQHPSCRRCILRGVDCYYPSTRLHDTTTSSSTDVSRTRHGNDSHQNLIPVSPASLERSYCSPPYSLSPSSSSSPSAASMQFLATHSRLYSDELLLLQGFGIGHNPTLFFLVPNSWSVTSSEVARRNDRTRHTAPQLSKSVNQVQRWVRQWVEEGSNMFIHKNLYYHDDNDDEYHHGRLQMPKCIQDAYTTCAAYFASTTKNRKMTLQIIEQRVAMLLEEQQERYPHQDNDDDNSQAEFISIEDPPSETSKTRSVQDHLARVQALLVYQLIRLYDGDMRSRIMAESLIPVLTRWCMQMLDSALLSSQYVYSMSTRAIDNTNNTNPASIEKKLKSDWHAWILAESVRRTWLVAGHMQCIYNVLSYGINACPGGLMFTPRAGLWHAESAYQWWARCREKTTNDMLLLCQSLETGSKLLGKSRPDEIDDFGRFVLQIIGDEEKVNRWLSVR